MSLAEPIQKFIDKSRAIRLAFVHEKQPILSVARRRIIFGQSVHKKDRRTAARMVAEQPLIHIVDDDPIEIWESKLQEIESGKRLNGRELARWLRHDIARKSIPTTEILLYFAEVFEGDEKLEYSDPDKSDIQFNKDFDLVMRLYGPLKTKVSVHPTAEEMRAQLTEMAKLIDSPPKMEYRQKKPILEAMCDEYGTDDVKSMRTKVDRALARLQHRGKKVQKKRS